MHHLEGEEHEVFPKVQKALGAAKLNLIGVSSRRQGRGDDAPARARTGQGGRDLADGEQARMVQRREPPLASRARPSRLPAEARMIRGRRRRPDAREVASQCETCNARRGHARRPSRAE